jgi:hypothetical protein
MRILDARYSRDLRRYELAMRLMGYEVRTRTICYYTGLSRARIQALGRSDYPKSAGVAAVRHRGPAPYRLDPVLVDARSRSDCLLIASLVQLMADAPQATAGLESSRNDLVRAGEWLCLLYETYQQISLDARLSFEQTTLVHSALMKGKRLVTSSCAHCGSLILRDTLEVERLTCNYCVSLPLATRAIDAVVPIDPAKKAAEPGAGYQHKLF